MYKINEYVSIPVIVFGNVCVAVEKIVSVTVSDFGLGERRMGKELIAHALLCRKKSPQSHNITWVQNLNYLSLFNPSPIAEW